MVSIHNMVFIQTAPISPLAIGLLDAKWRETKVAKGHEVSAGLRLW